MTSLRSFYRGRTVLVTGHTGFKGSWLSVWLNELGAKVVGYSLDLPSTPNNFEASGLSSRVADIRGDVRDFESFASAVEQHHPSVIFHLAAQSLVRRGYRAPRETFETNVMGTVNVLDAALRIREVEAVVSITSDKCYDASGADHPHREDDRLGGRDPYSASKACAELATNVYRDRRFQSNAVARPAHLPVSSVRAGNVIGGGDWADDRLVPDVVRAASAGQDVIIRNPDAIRPWQHVLEPLSGYLWLAVLMTQDPDRFASSYNFGPRANEPAAPVTSIVESLLAAWDGSKSRMVIERDTSNAEMPVLRVDSTRAESVLRWSPAWPLTDAIANTAAWYRRYYETRGPMFDYSVAQIHEYTETAREKGVAWAAAS